MASENADRAPQQRGRETRQINGVELMADSVELMADGVELIALDLWRNDKADPRWRPEFCPEPNV